MAIFSKHHGLGNDFLVLFDHEPGGAPISVPDPAALARRVCDRRWGIGADGLLIASEAEGHAAQMVLYNADGSRAEMSGNGIRCFAHAVAMRRGDLADQLVLTDAGDRTLTLEPTERPDTVLVTVEMGSVRPIDEPSGWAELGCHPDRPVAHLSLGNPHSVVGVDDVTDADLALLGGKVPHINLEIVQPTSRPDTIRMRVHERGVGVTEACGTGACAAASAAASWGLATPRDGKLVVEMDGGSATVELDSPTPGDVTLTGPATFVATIDLDIS